MTVGRRLLALLAIQGMLTARLKAGWRGLAGSAAAVVVVGMALALRLVLAPWLSGAQFITFFPAVIVATFLGGSVAGLVAVLSSAAAAAIAFAAPGIGNAVLLFVVVAIMDVAIISALLQAIVLSQTAERRVGNLNSALAASEARFRELLENAPDAMVIADTNTRIVYANASALRMFGYSAEELFGQSVDILMPERERGRHAAHFARFAAHRMPMRMGENQQLFGRRRDGSEFPAETNLSMLSGADEGLVCSTIRDVTWRREGEARQALLIRELNHRVKNTLASVQAIVTQTLKSAATPEAFSSAATARLMALSKSHDVLTRSDWSGAELKDIVVEQLSPYENGDIHRFYVSGPDLKLRPNRAVTLGMALGELATNAAKYGALSAGSEGSVHVSWTRISDAEGPRLSLRWTERGGPPVRKPTRAGFGSRLIQRSVAGGLQGKVRVEYARSGLKVDLEFPLLEGEA